MNPIFVAIDTPDLHRAAAIARDVRGLAGGVKLGLEFFCANGEEGVLRIAERALPVFLDLKFHDIPNTVGKAVEAVAHLQPAILTVHASGGRAMMAAAKAAAPPETRVVAVTVLTSLDQDDLASSGVTGSPADQVARPARSLAWPTSHGNPASMELSAPERRSPPCAPNGRTGSSWFQAFGRKGRTKPTRSGRSPRAGHLLTERRFW